ncbi:conserved hypothetical protein [Rubrivivax sp. A210]|uniref:DUF4178 domain-containing protein n=1 Tax=Rubrivivax sp. A210 TaxID=2772301 RepID=UPI00191AD04D|nr:DUF4178 domain-containing protein [Rubrivivax sp. A210]CAD5373726.1 conserved hypothetical protein [Rubrivivax sp. A210]
MAPPATSPQRAWRAACPNCGAPVEFASAASASAVCGYCRSTLLRDGEALSRIGVSAELFDDHSPLQLGASGRWQGLDFTLVGRLQYRFDGGSWNEWHALFGNGRSGWLSEDNGAYVLAFDAPLPAAAPALDELAAGEQRLIADQSWSVASVLRARLAAAQGELPRPPALGEREFIVADLRNAQDEVATLDGADPARPAWAVGRAVRLDELAMQGLREAVAKTLSGRALACPSCGAALAPTLQTTQSIVCGQCMAVVDVSQGVGAELAHHAQANAGHDGAMPRIPLGASGPLALGGPLRPWQVVGYVERCDIPAAGDDEETVYWREYLLYHRTDGFAFLVDAEDGWSWMRPLTGAPQAKGDRVQWQGRRYRAKYSYAARASWVLGEFYWRLALDDRAQVTDYIGEGKDSDRRLAREAVAGEVTWSEGAALKAQVVEAAFGLAAGRLAEARPTLGTLNAEAAGPLAKVALVVVVIALLFFMSWLESRDDCSALRDTYGASSAEYRQCTASSGSSGRIGGGSWGGYSSGGGHK